MYKGVDSYTMIGQEQHISNIKGVGPKTEKLFQKLGIQTVSDLMTYYPTGYQIYRSPVDVNELEEGAVMAVVGRVIGGVSISNNRSLPIVTTHLQTKTGVVKCTWFRATYLKSVLKAGMEVVVRGKIVVHGTQYGIEHPELFANPTSYLEKVGVMQPIYSVTKGLTNHTVTKTIAAAWDAWIQEAQEVLHADTRKAYQLCTYQEAVYGVHFPENQAGFIEARKRLVFQEFLSFLVAVAQLKNKEKQAVHNRICVQDTSKQVQRITEQLPFALTKAQQKVWEEIQRDLGNPQKIMSRLIQGDVGSGKTIVAVLSMFLLAYAGYQSALMAPTEVLAKQHYRAIQEMLERYQIPFQVVVLTGSMTAKEKRKVYAQIESGEAQLIVGTHALIQEKVTYCNLGLVITDEQHRFGVKQREQLSNKGMTPHVLVMSATPIPRTLAIILYGDLDISVIDELPANRLPIKNCVVGTDYRPKAYAFMQKQVQEGRQCYVICPMVEESEHLDGENVIDYAKQLQQQLGQAVCVSYLHGKMKQVEKDEIMEQYYQKHIDVLVSTTVIEVGINVPNATTMLIENAERFGLSGLHQLRGRVGRGEHQSYCIFMTATKSKETKKKLEILGQSNDGFLIANEDLKLRGPGDLFGVRQSGIMNFKLGDIIQDAKLLQLASEAINVLSQEELEALGKIHAMQDGVII